MVSEILNLDKDISELWPVEKSNMGLFTWKETSVGKEGPAEVQGGQRKKKRENKVCKSWEWCCLGLPIRKPWAWPLQLEEDNKPNPLPWLYPENQSTSMFRRTRVVVVRVIFLTSRGAPRKTDQESWYHHVDAHFSSCGIRSSPSPLTEQLFASHDLKDFSSLIGKPK